MSYGLQCLAKPFGSLPCWLHSQRALQCAAAEHLNHMSHLNDTCQKSLLSAQFRTLIRNSHETLSRGSDLMIG